MKITLYNHADEFLDDNKEFIYANSLEADLVYGNAHCSLSKEEGFYGASVKRDSEIMLATQTGSFPRVHFSNCKNPAEFTDVLAQSYVMSKDIPKTINGDSKTVHALLSSLKKHNLKYNLHMDLIKRKCTELSPVKVLYLKIINAKDIDFDFTGYYIAFVEDCRMAYDKDTVEEKTEKLVNSGNLYALVNDGKVVTMAASSRKAENGRALNMVYTPPEYRGLGYSTCCVKQITEAILKEHDYAFLYADKDNAISNHVYEKLGYKAFGDFCQYDLDSI